MKSSEAVVGKLAEAYLEIRKARKLDYPQREQECLVIMETLFWVLDKKGIDPLSKEGEDSCTK